MPKKKIIQKDDLDRFYTKPEIALRCIEICTNFVTDPYKLYVEPSAGSGSFFLSLPENKIGIDLYPACEGIIQHDWLTYEVPLGCVVIGNPPFGRRNTLTNKFIRHSISKCDILAFILPSVYCKESMQKVFPPEWSLVSSTTLPENSFMLDGIEYHVPCQFQVWIKNSTLLNLRESVKVKNTTNDFSFTDKDNADYFIFGAAPTKIIDRTAVLSNNRGYWIKCSDDVRDRLKKIDWRKYGLSSVNGGVAWFPKQQIIDIYHKEYELNDKQQCVPCNLCKSNDQDGIPPS